MELTKERAVSAPEALKIMEKRQKDGELSYEQQNTLTHLEKTAKMPVKDADALEKALTGLDLKLSDKQMAMLITLLPKNADEIRQILAQEKTDATDEQVKAVLDAVKSAQ
ncbi:hypothetical protein HYV43_07135 [Candidatus Micrarchaeota archaeon]|nr:hypothetical protein [Candidatus Micrarchaeota archaeon]